MVISDVNTLKRQQYEQIRNNSLLSKIALQNKLDRMWEDDHMCVISRDNIYWVTHSTLPIRGAKLVMESNLGTPFPKECLRDDQIERLERLIYAVNRI